MKHDGQSFFKSILFCMKVSFVMPGNHLWSLCGRDFEEECEDYRALVELL